MLLSPAAEKVTKERRSWGRGASKFGGWDWQLKFSVHAEFFAILSPLRNPLSCAPAERVRWSTFLSDCNWDRWCWFRWERTGMRTKRLRSKSEPSPSGESSAGASPRPTAGRWRQIPENMIPMQMSFQLRETLRLNILTWLGSMLFQHGNG